MENAIVLEEKRSVVEKFRGWYKKNIVDTGYSSTAEEILDKGIILKNAVDKLIIKGLEIGISYISDTEDVIKLLPVIQKLSEQTSKILEKATIGTKRFIEAKLIGVDGSSKDVILPDVNVKDYVDDVVDLVSEVDKFDKTKKDVQEETSTSKEDEIKEETNQEISSLNEMGEKEEIKGRTL